jgi:hypothetical protein
MQLNEPASSKSDFNSADERLIEKNIKAVRASFASSVL